MTTVAGKAAGVGVEGAVVAVGSGGAGRVATAPQPASSMPSVSESTDKARFMFVSIMWFERADKTLPTAHMFPVPGQQEAGSKV